MEKPMAMGAHEAYEPPALTELGTVSELTAANETSGPVEVTGD
ncbi:MAG: lasso RiPP family leader peptide-containing protein [Gaiellaceae bacterium]